MKVIHEHKALSQYRRPKADRNIILSEESATGEKFRVRFKYQLISCSLDAEERFADFLSTVLFKFNCFPMTLQKQLNLALNCQREIQTIRNIFLVAGIVLAPGI